MRGGKGVGTAGVGGLGRPCAVRSSKRARQGRGSGRSENKSRLRCVRVSGQSVSTLDRILCALPPATLLLLLCPVTAPAPPLSPLPTPTPNATFPFLSLPSFVPPPRPRAESRLPLPSRVLLDALVSRASSLRFPFLLFSNRESRCGASNSTAGLRLREDLPMCRLSAGERRGVDKAVRHSSREENSVDAKLRVESWRGWEDCTRYRIRRQRTVWRGEGGREKRERTQASRKSCHSKRPELLPPSQSPRANSEAVKNLLKHNGIAEWEKSSESLRWWSKSRGGREGERSGSAPVQMVRTRGIGRGGVRG